MWYSYACTGRNFSTFSALFLPRKDHHSMSKQEIKTTLGADGLRYRSKAAGVGLCSQLQGGRRAAGLMHDCGVPNWPRKMLHGRTPSGVRFVLGRGPVDDVDQPRRQTG